MTTRDKQLEDWYSNRQVKLVSCTAPTEEIKKHAVFNAEHMIAYCARVSNPDNQGNVETTERLLNYLIKHKHWSPFEMVNACIEIRTTRDIARQILRHRSFSFQEFSQRYADPTKDLKFIYREARLQDKTNRQNSLATDNKSLQDQWTWQQELVEKVCRGVYDWAIEAGIAKEVARSVLPEGMMESVLYVNGSIRSWIHYLELRTDKSTQKEHRLVAEGCLRELSKVIPSLLNKQIYVAA
jgi:thymidylate synthase (FAD)